MEIVCTGLFLVIVERLNGFVELWYRLTKINSDITFRHVHLIPLALNASRATVSLTIKNSQIFLNG